MRVVLSAGALVDRQPIAAELGRAVHLVQRADGAWQLIRVRQARIPLRAPIAVESQPHPQRGGGQPRRRPVRDQTFGKVPGRVREGSVEQPVRSAGPAAPRVICAAVALAGAESSSRSCAVVSTRQRWAERSWQSLLSVALCDGTGR